MTEKLVREKVKINGVTVNLMVSGSSVFSKNNNSIDVAKNSKTLRKLASDSVKF